MYLCTVQITFQKYQGAGNDFIMLDNRSGQYSSIQESLIAHLCDRNRGVGADGLIMIEASNKGHFKMVYFNSDGKESSMCGNGGRCSVAFAHTLQMVPSECVFEAIDGLHKAVILSDKSVQISMNDVSQIESYDDALVMNTGSPHCVVLKNDIDTLEIIKEATKIRHAELFKSEGINVNYIATNESGELQIRTYERGVENETLACGTGAVAAAIAADFWDLHCQKSPMIIKALGGTLKVGFVKTENGYEKIVLSGQAKFVFSGEIS